MKAVDADQLVLEEKRKSLHPRQLGKEYVDDSGRLKVVFMLNMFVRVKMLQKRQKPNRFMLQQIRDRILKIVIFSSGSLSEMVW